MNWAKRYNRRPQYVNISTEAKSYLRKADLSLGAIAMLTIMLSEAETWQFSVSGYVKKLPNSSEYQIRKSLLELEKKHYLIRRQKRINGMYSGNEYVFSDICFSDEEIKEILEYRDEKQEEKVEDSPEENEETPENRASAPCDDIQRTVKTPENRASAPCDDIQRTVETPENRASAPCDEIPRADIRRQRNNKLSTNNIYLSTNNTVLSSTKSKINSKGDKASKNEKSRFKIPSYEEVQKYCRDNNLNFSIQDFLDYYDSLDWKIDGSEVRSWKSLAKCWDSNQFVYDSRTVGSYGYSFCSKLPEEILNAIASDQNDNPKGYIRSSTKKIIDDWIEGR